MTLCDGTLERITTYNLRNLYDFFDFLSRSTNLYPGLYENLEEYTYYYWISITDDDLFTANIKDLYDDYIEESLMVLPVNVMKEIKSKIKKLPNKTSEIYKVIQDNEKIIYKIINETINDPEERKTIIEKKDGFFNEYVGNLLYLHELYNQLSNGKLPKDENIIINEYFNKAKNETMFLMYLEDNLIGDIIRDLSSGFEHARNALESVLKDDEIILLDEFDEIIGNPYCIARSKIYYELTPGMLEEASTGTGNIFLELPSNILSKYSPEFIMKKFMENKMIGLHKVYTEELIERFNPLFKTISFIKITAGALKGDVEKPMNDFRKIEEELYKTKDFSDLDFGKRVINNIDIPISKKTNDLYVNSYIAYLVSSHVYISFFEHMRNVFKSHYDEEEANDLSENIKYDCRDIFYTNIFYSLYFHLLERFKEWKHRY